MPIGSHTCIFASNHAIPYHSMLLLLLLILFASYSSWLLDFLHFLLILFSSSSLRSHLVVATALCSSSYLETWFLYSNPPMCCCRCCCWCCFLLHALSLTSLWLLLMLNLLVLLLIFWFGNKRCFIQTWIFVCHFTLPSCGCFFFLLFPHVGAGDSIYVAVTCSLTHTHTHVVCHNVKSFDSQAAPNRHINTRASAMAEQQKKKIRVSHKKHLYM